MVRTNFGHRLLSSRKILAGALLGLAGLVVMFQNCSPGFEVLGDVNSASQGGDADALTPPGTSPGPSGLSMKSLGGFRYQAGFCGVESEGRLVCWGHKGSPKSEIVSLTAKVTDTVAYSSTQCALTVDGKVLCWRTYPTWATPVELAVPKTIQIAASNISGCALTADHRVLCWSGANTTDITEITELAGATSITDNITGICGVLPTKTVRCVTRTAPRNVSEIANVLNAVEIRSGGGYPVQVCALEQAGDLKCFGGAPDPQTNVHVWNAATLFSSNIRLFDVGGDGGVCAVRMDDHILCSGNNDVFQINNSSVTNYANAVDVVTLAVRAIRKSQYGTTCVLTTTGGVRCWGSDDASLGFDRVHFFDKPIRFDAFDGIKQIGYLGNYTLPDIYMLKDNGDVYCRSGGRLNLSAPIPATEVCGSPLSDNPVAFQNLKNVSQIESIGGVAMCGRLVSGQVTCWGQVQAGIRQPSNESSFGVIPGLAGSTQIGFGGYHLCALIGQKISCARWVVYPFSSGPYTAPVQLIGNASITQMAVGSSGVCGLTTVGRVVCWGGNAPTTASETDLGLTDVIQVVTVGASRICGLLANGTAACWSLADDTIYNGDGTTTEVVKYQPVAVMGLTTIAKLYAAEGNADSRWNRAMLCGIRTSGTVACKGVIADADTKPDVSLFAAAQSLFVYSDFVCSRTAAGTSCSGRKPYRLATDFLGEALRF